LTVEEAAALLGPARAILVFTGAGVSTESGIPDFRGPDGLWTRLDPDDFTIQRYLTNKEIRVRNWRLHQEGELWGARSSVRPNRAHHAVVELHRMGRLAGVVTQNIDGLHLAAGLDETMVAELHGNVRRAHCVTCRQVWPIDEVLSWVDAGEEDPHCPDCLGLVKPATVMFGEYLPEGEVAKAESFADRADAVLAVGTTLSVWPAADIPLRAKRRGAPLVIVNLGPTEADHVADLKLEAPAGETLERLVTLLRDQ
jgi:NAD-dependent deacetylase